MSKLTWKCAHGVSGQNNEGQSLLKFLWLCLLFVAVHNLSLVAKSRSYSLAAVNGLLIVGASLVVEHRL